MSALPASDAVDTTITVTALTHQYGDGLLGLPLAPIRLRWRVSGSGSPAEQVGYQVRMRRVADTEWIVAEPVTSSAQLDVDAPGEALRARERREYAVRVASSTGWSEWSATLRVEGGLATEDLVASVVGIPSEIEGAAPIVRHEFDLRGTPSSARLHLSSLGVNDAFLNGAPVSDDVLAPGWTSYGDRVLVATHDVTHLLRSGRNAISASVSDGWYRGRFGFQGRTAIYGDSIGVLAQLEVEFEDGRTQRISSDTGWRGGFGSIQAASIYDGSTIDLRRTTPVEASVPGFDDGEWSPVHTIAVDRRIFQPRISAPVRPVAELPMTQLPRGGRVQLDAGQNIAGWVRLVVRGSAGSRVTVRHAEILEPSGDLHTAALRSAKATDVYILASDGEVTLEPAFTFHGFRYAEIETDATIISAAGIAISSDIPVRSRFASSDPELNRFHDNVVWSQRDNFVSVPTDCPQRDERLGWTGDAQAFAATASTLFHAETFWRSWLIDLELDQTDEGGVASVVPDIILREELHMGGPASDPMGRAGWADAATIVPMAVYESTGSDEVLRQQLRSMRRWVEHLRRRAGDDVVLPTEPFQYGDWLDPDAPGDRPWDAKVSSDYVANAFYVWSARLLARAERIVGDTARGDEYDALATRVADHTWERWGEEAIATQTGAAIALEFGIAPESRRDAVAAGLAANVRENDGRIATGFLGTPLVLFALSRSGHTAEAYRMLLRREAPSWLYQVERGATTVWERWDAILPDGSIHSGEMDTTEGDRMLSFNHYAYGAMIDWVYRNVAGLAPDAERPGYRHVTVAPRPADGIRWATASIETAFGELAIDWRLDADDALRIDLTVPFGATASLDLPLSAGSVVTVDGEHGVRDLQHGSHTIVVTDPVVVPSRVASGLLESANAAAAG